MGNCKEAAFAFKKFVALKSELPEKQRTWLTELIAQLDACAAQQAAAPPPPR